MTPAPVRRVLFAAGILAGLTATAQDVYFAPPQRVTLEGYDGDAMEPFLSRDGQYLLFNNRNDPGVDTNLHVARRIDDLTFAWKGELAGANSRMLDGVPSIDDRGNLYFISVRAYAETFSTLYRGRFDGTAVLQVEPVNGISRRLNGFVNFDAEISLDGQTLFFVDGQFDGGPLPRAADIAIATRDAGRFRRLPESERLLASVNTAALEYAPAVSEDLLELLFTRIDRRERMPSPAILRAVRGSVREPFGEPQRVDALAGFVEAPALSLDGRLVYFHKLERGRFVLYMSRRAAPAPQPDATTTGEPP